MPLLVAQERPPVYPFIRATGESTIQVKPDQATVTIGVVTQAATAEAAAAQNAAQLTGVLNKIKSVIGARGDVKTSSYSVNPNFSYPNPPSSGGPKIAGYTASNTVRVKLDDVALAGRVVDAATASGANHIQDIQFSVKDEAGVGAQALQEAARKARASCETMAAALGMRIIGVRSAESGSTSFARPMMAMDRMATAQAARAPTPVDPGDVRVSAVVTVTVEVAP